MFNSNFLKFRERHGLEHGHCEARRSTFIGTVQTSPSAGLVTSSVPEMQSVSPPAKVGDLPSCNGSRTKCLLCKIISNSYTEYKAWDADYSRRQPSILTLLNSPFALAGHCLNSSPLSLSTLSWQAPPHTNSSR